MELVNDFVVNSPIEQTWATLTDVEKIAPCLPGAHLEEIDGNTFKGVVKLKVGPILANFKGDAHFIEKDDVNHRAVLNASGRDTGNKGNASAVITAKLEALGEKSTKCTVSTDLKITGKFAQFGRGAMQDISAKLLGEFVHNLESLTAAQPPVASPSGDGVITDPPSTDGAAAGSTAGAAAGNGAPTAAAQPVRRSDEVLDLGQVAGPAILKRVLPVVAALFVLYLLLRRRRRTA